MALAIVIGVVFLGVGVALLLVGISQRKRAKEAEAWPTAPGVILASGLQENRHYDSEHHRTEINYEPQVQYQFTLMGQTYQGNSISFGKVSYDFRTATKKIAPYPQGAPVVVHYNPSDPNKSVLEPKAAGSVMLYILGILFMIIGLGIAVSQLL